MGVPKLGFSGCWKVLGHTGLPFAVSLATWRAWGGFPCQRKVWLLQGFGSFCAVFVLLGFLISILIAPMGDSEGKCYHQGYFPLLCLCGFVLFPCSRHTQPSVPVSTLKISWGTGLLLQSQGHKKSITYYFFLMVMKLRKTHPNWMFCGNCPSCLCFVIGESHFSLAGPQTAVLRWGFKSFSLWKKFSCLKMLEQEIGILSSKCHCECSESSEWEAWRC